MFKLERFDGRLGWPAVHRVSKIVSAIGERWAARLMPPQLMELMRHESIETTLL